MTPPADPPRKPGPEALRLAARIIAPFRPGEEPADLPSRVEDLALLFEDLVDARFEHKLIVQRVEDAGAARLDRSTGGSKP